MSRYVPASRPLLPLAALVLLLVSSACRGRTGAERFVGEYRWRQMFGYQAILLEEGGKASYSMVLAAEDPGAPPTTEVHAGTYRVVGDTAFVVVDWPDEGARGDTLALMLRGDTLVMLNQVLGGNPTFVRAD